MQVVTLVNILIFSAVLFLSSMSFGEEGNSVAQIKHSTPNAHQFTFISIDGEPINLNDYKNKVVLVVNTASQCGFTKQYEDLQNLYETYKDQGLVVLAVPCNDFGSQEPGDEEVIKEFVKNSYGVTFPLTQKYSVNGSKAHPFFEWAQKQKKGGFMFSKPRWNFHKFLVDKKGDLYKSYGSQVSPMSAKMIEEIEGLLKS